MPRERYVMQGGLWRNIVGGGVIEPPPPPPPSQAPGGGWGTAPRAGAITDISGVNPRTTQFNHASVWSGPATDGARINAGLGAARTVWTYTGDYRITGTGTPTKSPTSLSRFNMWRGGKVVGDSPQDGSWPWSNETAHQFHDQTGFRVEPGTPDLTVEYYCAINVGDGIGFGGMDFPGSCDGFVWRWCSIEDGKDNCFSNDAKHRGIVYQCYFMGASLYESRPDTGQQAESYDPGTKACEFDGCGLWLKGQRYSDMSPNNDPTNFGAAVVQTAFKMQQGAFARFNVHLKFRNSMFRYDDEPKALRSGGGGTWSVPAGVITEWTNVGICYPTRNRSQGSPLGWPAVGTPGITFYFLDDAGNDLTGVPRASLAKSNWNRFMERLQVNGGADMLINNPGTFAGV